MYTSDDFLTEVGKFADTVMLAGEEKSASARGGLIDRRFSSVQRDGRRFKRIGSGQYAAVFDHPFYADRVIKVGLSSGGNPQDDAWLNYATASMQLPANPYSMRVYSIRLFETAYVAEIERLEAFNDPDENQYAVDWTNTMEAVFEDGLSWASRVQELSQYDEFNEENFEYYVKLFKAIGKPTDLHNENVMWRKNGAVTVVTDPYHKKASLRVKVSASSYAQKDYHGVSVIDAERMSNGRLPGIRYAEPSVGGWPVQEDDALRLEPFNAVQPHVHALSRILSQVRAELVPQGSNLIERLRAA